VGHAVPADFLSSGVGVERVCPVVHLPFAICHLRLSLSQLAIIPFVLFAVAATAAPTVPASKKGLQVQMVDDALALGIRHAALNVNLTSLVDPAHRPGSLAWTLEGETFHFHRGAVERIPIKPLSDAGVSVALILLTYESSDTNLNRLMLHPRRAARMDCRCRRRGAA